MCKVYTGYCGTSEIEHGLCVCTVDNPLAKARGLSLRTSAQTMLYLSLNHLNSWEWKRNRDGLSKHLIWLFVFVITVELQWLEHWWLVYHGCFELVLESLGNNPMVADLGNLDLFSFFILKTVYCVYSLESPQWGDSNENTQHTFILQKIKEILIMPPDLVLLSALTGSNYPCLELIFMVPKVFEPLKFDWICCFINYIQTYLIFSTL